MTVVDKDAANTIGSMLNAKRYASKGVAGTALGLGIAGTALNLFGDRLGGLFGHPHHVEHDIDRVLAKENADVLMLTNQMWGNVVATNQKIFDGRVYTDTQIREVTKDANDKFFVNYKETRDAKDALSAEISALRTEVAVLKAVAPYQQELNKAAVDAASQQAILNLAIRTQRMLEGVLVSPAFIPALNDVVTANRTTTTTTPTTTQG